MIVLGITYIASGIYGYSFASRTDRLSVHLVYFISQLILGGAIIYLGQSNGFTTMVLLPLAGQSVVLLSKNWRFLVSVGIVVTYGVALALITGNNWEVIWSGLPIFLAALISIVVFTQMAVTEEQNRGEVEKLVRELEEANQHLREYALQIEELAVTKERNRMAREIHDGLGHYLTTIYMQIQAARAVMKIDTGKAQEALSTAQTLTQDALVDVRQSVSALRDMPGDTISMQEEIEKMLKRSENMGLSANMKINGSPRPLSPQVLFTMYRTIQEGINNTCKHAHAAHLSVVIDYTRKDQVKMTIQDDGIGADQTDGGFGLVGMRERISMLDGNVKIDTKPGNGFRLEISLPG